MVCKKCGSENVNVVMDTAQTIKRSGCLWGLGRLVLIVFTFGLWLIVPQRVGHTKSRPVALCQNCGNKWYV